MGATAEDCQVTAPRDVTVDSWLPINTTGHAARPTIAVGTLPRRLLQPALRCPHPSTIN